MSETVERVAEALWVANSKDRFGKWSGLEGSWKDKWRDDARAALAAMPSWQPISSAPKDGTDILVVCAPDGDSRVVFWDEDMQPGDLGLFAWGITDADKIYFHENAFTHWMPLPSPPEAV